MGLRLRALVRKELIQTLRDVPIVVLSLYIFAEIVLCGWALTMDVRHVPTAVVDRDQTPASRDLVRRFRAVDAFALDRYPAGEAELERLLDTGEVSLGIVIPAGFGGSLAGGRPAEVQALLDGTETNASLLTMGYVLQVVRDYSAGIEVERLERTAAGALSGLPRVVNEIRAWYLPGMTYIHFIMVSMVTLAVFMLGVVLAAAAIMREKEAGTLEQIMVTPTRPLELVAAKILPMVLLEVVGLAIGLVLSYAFFGVSQRGPNPAWTLALFFALSILAFLASAGIGVWIATASRNLQQALLLAFFILFPVMFLSGTLVPVTSMPWVLERLSLLSPMRHYLTIGLDLFLKGVGMATVWPHVLVLAGFTAAVMAIGVGRFRRSLT